MLVNMQFRYDWIDSTYFACTYISCYNFITVIFLVFSSLEAESISLTRHDKFMTGETL